MLGALCTEFPPQSIDGSHKSKVNPADIDTCTCNALGMWNALGGWQVVTTHSARGGPKNHNFLF